MKGCSRLICKPPGLEQFLLTSLWSQVFTMAIKLLPCCLPVLTEEMKSAFINAGSWHLTIFFKGTWGQFGTDKLEVFWESLIYGILLLYFIWNYLVLFLFLEGNSIPAIYIKTTTILSNQLVQQMYFTDMETEFQRE